MIQVQKVSKAFGKLKILDKVEFELKSGEKASLIGPGGCGKTTLLKLILGLIEPDQGDIFLLGNSINNSPAETLRKALKGVGMAFQQGALFDYLTVEENLFFAMDNMTDLCDLEKKKRAHNLLDIVKLPHTKNMFPHELSGGMQRRIGIARALATDPKLAIFDEPTSGLDPVTSTIVLQMIDSLGKICLGHSLLVATSSIEAAIRFADRVIVLHQGQIVADGPWRQLLIEGEPWVKNFLSIRLIGIDIGYAQELGLPQKFIDMHW